MTLKILSLY